MRFVTRALALSVTSALFVGLAPGLAHAATPALQSTTPANGSAVKADPATLSATFSTALASGSLSVSGPSSLTCAATVSGSTISCSPTKVPAGAFAEGTYTVAYNVTALSTPPNTASGTFTFTLDKTAPVAPTSLTVSPAVYTAADLAAGHPITVLGTSEKVGDSVAVTLHSSGGGTDQTRTVTAGTGGAFSAAFTGALADGTLTATARSTDAAGNTGPSATATAAKDTTPPAVVGTTPVNGGAERSMTNSQVSSYTVTSGEALGSTSSIDLLDSTGALVATSKTFPDADSISVAPAAFPVGDYSVTIHLVDAAGNAAAPVTRSFSIDDAAPEAPVLSTVTDPVNAGSKTAFAASGTAEAGSLVAVTVASGASTVSTTATATGGTFSVTGLDVSSLPDGPLSVTATATDAAGNTSAPSAPKAATKDTVAPVVSGQQLDQVTYNSTNDDTATVSGVVGNGASGHEADTVTVSVDDTDPTTPPVTGTATSQAADGTFAVTPLDLSSLKDTTLTATVTAQDAHGNTSTAVTTTAAHDATAPVQPTVSVKPYVNLANQANYVVSGKTDAGADVKVTIADTGSGTTSKTVVADGTGFYTAGFDLSGAGLADGPLAVSAVATDAAGNHSTAGTATTTKDTKAPAAPTATSPSYITASTTANVPVSGTGEVGATVTVHAHDATTHTATATATVDTDGSWAALVDTSAFDDGTVTFDATATDVAGNTGLAGSTTSTKDTTAPTAATGLTTSPSAYVYANRAGSLTVNGSTQDDSTLTVLLTVSDSDPSTADLTAATGVSGAAFTHDFLASEVGTLTDGTLTVTAVVRDLAGNLSPATTTTLVKDTTPLAQQSLSPANGDRVQSASAVVAVFNEALNQGSSTITVKNHLGNALAGTLTFTNGGRTMSFTPGSAFSEAGSAYSVTVHAVDLNDGADAVGPTTTSFVIDKTPPAAPVLTSVTHPVNAADTAHVQVAGTAEAGSSVTVTAAVGGTALTATAPATSGTFSITNWDLSSLPDGPLSFTATAQDVAANTSAVSSAVAVTKDTVQPVVTVAFDRPAYDAADVASAVVAGTVGNGSGAPEADDVTFTVDDTDATTPAIVTTVTAGSGGTFSVPVDLTSLTDGPLSVTATATDAVGNASQAATATSSKDVVAPGQPSATVTDPVNSVTVGHVTVSGTAEPASHVLVSVDDADAATAAVTTTLDADPTTGDWGTSTLDLSSLTDGALTVTAVAVDEAGNTSPAGTAYATKDTVSPVQTAADPATGTSVQPPAAVVVTFTKALAGSSSIAVPGVTGTSSVSGSTLTFTPDAPFADGTYTATATGVDADGNSGTGSTTFTVDSTPPVVSALAGTATNVSHATTSVTGTLSEAASVVLSATDGTTTVPGAVTVSGSSFTGTVDLSSLKDGVVTLTAQATDAAGNTGPAVTATVSKDATPPVVSALAGTATNVSHATTSVTGTLSEAASVVLSATDGTTTVTGAVTVSGTSFTGTVDLSSLKDGAITLTAQATDAAGNTGSVVTTSVANDQSAPVVSALAGTATNVSQATTSVTGTLSEAASVVLSATDGTTTVPGAVTVTGTSFTGTVDLSSLKDGVVTLTARATDAAGNTGSAVTTSVANDQSAPVVSALAGTATNASHATTNVSGSLSEAASVVLSATDGTTTVPGAVTVTGTSFTGTVDLSSLKDGVVTLTAQATDAAGNTGPAVTATVSKDATAPAVTSLLATAATWSQPATTVTVTVGELSSVVVTATDGAKSVSATATVAPNQSFTTSLDLSALANGPVSVTARATDAAGNTGSAATTTSKDSATPPRSFTAPAAVGGDRSATVSFATPAADPSAPVTGYTVTASPGGATAHGTASPITVTGLANGTAYTFTVTATNRVGSSTTASSPAVTPRGTSSVTLKALPSKVVAGTAITLAGTVSRTDSSVALQPLVVKARYDNGTVVTLAKVTPSSTGSYAFRYAPRIDLAYSVVYPGDAKVTAFATTFRRVLAAAKVTASAPSGAHTTAQVVTGSVFPNKAGKLVTLYRVSSTGALVKLATARLSSTSAYRFAVLLPRGYTTLVVAIGATTNNAAGAVRFRASRT